MQMYTIFVCKIHQIFDITHQQSLYTYLHIILVMNPLLLLLVETTMQLYHL